MQARMSLREASRTASSAAWVWRTAFSASTARRPYVVRPSAVVTGAFSQRRCVAYAVRSSRWRCLRIHERRAVGEHPLGATLLLRARGGGEGSGRRGE